MSPSYFTILGAMRTGSNLLERLLAQFPGVITHGEAFNPAFIGGPQKEPLAGWDLVRRDADPLGYLATIRQAAGRELPGFRHFNGHDAQIRAHVLADPDCARIVLRRDPAESYVSLKIARETDQWMLNTPRRRLVAQIRFDAAEFDAYRGELESYYAALEAGMKAAGQSALHVSYDELLAPETLSRLADHLGLAVPETPPDPGIHRQNPEPIFAKVSNPDEMRAHLGGTSGMETAAAQREMFHASGARLSFLPISGGDRRFGLRLMHWLERRDHGAEAMTPAQLLAPETCPFTREIAGSEALTARIAFTVAEPPDWRLARLYQAQCFGGKSCLPHVRTALDEATGPLGRFRVGRDNPAPHRDRLARFIELMAEARAGRGRHPVHEGWQSQTEELATLRRIAPNLAILRTESPAQESDRLMAKLEIEPLAADILVRFRNSEEDLSTALIDDEIKSRLANLYPED
ncbi:MAG: hypothetical protein AAGI13_09900 [Pseudomonadota bacterium]